MIGETPIHPGEILAEELEALGLNGSELANALGVPKNRIYQILEGKRSVTADTALRFGKFFGTGPKFRLNLQKAYEFDVALAEAGDTLAAIVPHGAVVAASLG